MNSFLLTIAATLVLALSAAFAVPYFVDWNDYRHVFEGQASKLIGRAVFVGGDVRLRLLPTPLVSFDEVRIADARGQIDTPFAQAKSFTMWLSLPPLLRGQLEARDIEIEQPTINLRVLPDGGANWRDMGRREDALVFNPSDVAMESVDITGGTLAVYRRGQTTPIRIEDITGEFSARSLEGPYKFAGTFSYQGVERELRFSTGGPQENSGIRLKSVVRETDGPDSYSLDGTLVGINERPRFGGQISARFGAAPAAEGAEGAKAAGPLPALAVRSQIDAGLNQATFEDLEVTIRKDQKPQTLKGQLALAWHDGLDLSGAISSRWLDLDTLVLGGKEKPKSAGQAIAKLTNKLLKESRAIQRGRLELQVQKAMIAGEVVSDLISNFDVDGDNLRINDLSATLPGPSELNLSGALRKSEQGPEYQGIVALRGNHMSRLVKWAGVEQQNLSTSDGTDFSLDARVIYGSDKLLLEDAKGTLLGSAYSGGLRYQTGERRLFTLELKSERLDLTKAFGENASVGNLVKLLADRDKANADVSPAKAQYEVAGWLERGEARVDLSIGSVTLPGFDQANLAAKFSLLNGDLTIHRLNLKSGKGLTMRAEGGLADLNARPDGRIMLTADAAGPKDIGALWTLLELPSRDLIEERAEMLAPMKVALAIESKRRSGGGLEARLGGAAGASNLALTGKFQGELAAYDKGQIDIDGTVSNSNGADLLRQLFPHLTETRLAPFKGKRAVAMLKALGAVGGSLKGNASFETEGLRWQIEGEADGSEGLRLAGQTTIDANEAALALTLVGLDVGKREQPAPLAIQAGLSKKEHLIELSDMKGTIDGAQFGGTMRFDLSSETPVVDAEINTAQTSFSSLLRPVVDWSVRKKKRATRSRRRQPRRRQRQAETPPQPPARPTGPPWSDRPFKDGVLASVAGSLKLRSDTLELVPGLELKEAELNAQVKDGKLEIPALTGWLHGGQAKISATLTQKAPAMAFAANASLKQVKLDQATSIEGAAPLAGGGLDLQLNLAGEGLTAKGLVTSLAGGGTLAIAEASVQGLSPAALKQVAQSEVNAEVSRGSALPGRVQENFQQAVFAMETVNADFAVSEGTVRLEDMVLKGEQGQATLKSYLELPSFKFDSEWQLQAEGVGEEGDELQVTMVFAGPFHKFGEVKPSIKTEALKRYITVQRIARDVERKALSEAEREAARQNAAAQAVPVPPQPQPVTPARRTEPAQRAPATVLRPPPPPRAVRPAPLPRPAPAARRTVPVSPPQAREPAPVAAPPPIAAPEPPASDPAGMWSSTTRVQVPARGGTAARGQAVEPAPAQTAPAAESVAPPPQPAQRSRPRPRWTGPGRFDDFSEFSE